MKKRIMIMSAAVAVLGATAVVGTGAVTHAASAAGTSKHAQHAFAVRAEARLNQAVRDGVITTDQKTAAMTEIKTLRTERDAAISSTSTKAERQAERTKLKSELQSWATTNNFPLAKIFPHLAA